MAVNWFVMWSLSWAVALPFLSNAYPLLARISRLPSQSRREVVLSRRATQQQQQQQQQQEGCKEMLETQRLDLATALESADRLRDSVQRAEDVLEIESIETEINQLEQQVAFLPPVGLERSDYMRAIALFLRLPFTVRLALCEALDLNKGGGTDAVTDLNRVPEIVKALYEERYRLTPQRLQDSLKAARLSLLSTTSPRRQSFSQSGKRGGKKMQGSRKGILSSIFSEGTTRGRDDDDDDDDDRKGIIAQELLGRVSKQENRAATEKDLKTLMAVLKDKDCFVPRNSEAIPGGYVVRGRRHQSISSGEGLITALDKKLPFEWSSQVCYLPDITASGDEALSEEVEPVLVLLHRDMSQTAQGWLLSATTASAVFTVLLYAIGVYGSTDAIPNHLEELATVDGEFSGFTWFSGKVLEVILPLVVVQRVHELGHQIVAQRDSLKVDPPTLLPFWSLPFMGSKTQFKESPKSLTSLFDFAFLGPASGIVLSLALLVYGLQATTTVDSDMVQFLPALPIRVIQASTLGSSLVDNFIGAGTNSGYDILTTTSSLQESGIRSAAIPLHPFAIAGFTSLIIQCLDLLPLGSTDGGRMSLALFGRKGHAMIGALAWFSLLCLSLLGENVDILIGAWVVNNFAQNDPEVPCRNEVDQVSLPRILAAISLWFFAALVLTPIQLSS